jgi:hypothetical protein
MIIFRDRVSLCRAQNFLGLSMSDSRNESLHNKLKAFIPKQMNYTAVLKKVLEFIDHQNTVTARELEI